jgi:hypothetical protein
MSIIPSSLRFNITKGVATAPYQLVSYSEPTTVGSIGTEIVTTMSWISAGFYGSGARITVNDSGFWQGFTAGTYTGEVIINASYYDDYFDDVTGVRGQYKEELGRASVILTIKDPIVLSASPTTPAFNYQIGGVVPNAIQVNVTTLNPWTLVKTVPWISLSIASGTGNGTSNISVDPTGLSAGIYTSTVVLNDGTSTVNIYVTLNVSEVDSQVDYLYATPSEINFGFTLNGTLPPFKSVNLSASDYQNISITPPAWLQLESFSDTVKTWGLIAAQVNNLAPGVYSDVIIFQLGTIIKTVTVNLEIFKLVENLLDNTDLHFTDENNLIQTSSGRTDTHLSVSVVAAYEGEDYSLKYNVPFFKGVAKKRLGLEASKMIGHRNFIGATGISLIAPYNPVSLDIVVKELEVLTGIEQQTVSINGLKFLKGLKPVDNWMSDIPREIHVSKKAVIAFSILSQGSSVSEINITGSRTITHSINEITSELYSVVYPISDFDLLEGDQLEVAVLNEKLKVNIKPEGTDSTMVFWENDHGCWDAFELTGDFNLISALQKETSEVRKDHLTTETKIHSTVNRETYKVDTGFIYSDDEMFALNSMLRSKNIYLMYSGSLYNVEPITNSLELQKTDKQLRSATILFKSVIER